MAVGFTKSKSLDQTSFWITSHVGTLLFWSQIHGELGRQRWVWVDLGRPAKMAVHSSSTISLDRSQLTVTLLLAAKAFGSSRVATERCHAVVHLHVGGAVRQRQRRG